MTMKNLSSRIACAGIALLPLAALAGPTIYSDEASFLAALAPGYYPENFAGVAPGLNASPLPFSGGSDAASLPFSYTISSSLTTPGDGNLYKIPTGLSTELDGYALTYNFTSGNVQAVGGWFAIDDGAGTFLPGQIEFDLSDGTVVTLDVGAGEAFLGFAADGPTITGLNAFPIEGADPLYLINSQLFVGVPETSTYAAAGFMGLAVGGLWLRRSRKVA